MRIELTIGRTDMIHRHLARLLLLILLPGAVWAQFSKTIFVPRGGTVNAVTTWFKNGCTVVAIGYYVVDIVPEQGQLSFSDENLPIPGCSNGPQPSTVAYYTWTGKSPSITSDFFRLTYYADGQSEVIDITVKIEPGGKIFFEGKDITGTTQPVTIGQRIGLTASLPGHAQRNGANFWAVEGISVGGFSVSPSYAEPSVGGPVTTDFSQSGTVFFWVTPGYYRVTLSYLLNGAVITVFADFNVDGPDPSNVEATFGTVNVNNDRVARDNDGILQLMPELQLGGGEKGNIGVTFERSPAFNSGTFQWLQLVEAVEIEFYGLQRLSCKAPAGIDTSFPYPDVTATSTNDNPAADLDYPPFLLGTEVMSARMYLLWNPSLPAGCVLPGTLTGSGTCTSIAVPIGYVDWRWSGGAAAVDPDHYVWKIINSLSSTPPSNFQTTSNFPSWTHRVTKYNICNPSL